MTAAKKYHGSCHCQAVKFSAVLDFSKGTGRCNCTYCTKTRFWGIRAQLSDFELISGKEQLVDYTRPGTASYIWGDKIEARTVHHLFCKKCGVHAFGVSNIPEIGGDGVQVNVACLDDVDFKEVMKSGIRYMNGRDNDWFNIPAFTEHL